MEFNISNINATLSEAIENFLDIKSNMSDVIQNCTTLPNFNESQNCVGNLSETYICKEKQQLKWNRMYLAIFAVIIILSNSVVVISSGLILKKGCQPKSTYILLGNVSFADTLIGVALIIRAAFINMKTTDTLCVFQVGLLVCHTKVSILSVGLIAVDRYIFIMHGLYYQRWFNTGRVRIAVLCIWVIGIATGLMPLTGWVNKELISTHCVYYALFPGPLIVFNSIVSLTPIVIVAVLYTIILKRVLQNFAHIKATERPMSVHSGENGPPKLRMYRGKGNQTTACEITFEKCEHYTNTDNIKRSASFNTNVCIGVSYKRQESGIFKNKSCNDLTAAVPFQDVKNLRNPQLTKSELTVYTADSSRNNINSSDTTITDFNKVCKKETKKREPNKMRAIAVVTLTSCSIILTWTPYFVTVILFVFCEQKRCNQRCMYLNSLLSGPMTGWAFLNSILNPLIYAWWHKGFKNSIKAYYRKHLQQYFFNRQVN